MRVDFESLRKIIRDDTSKKRFANQSNVCLNELFSVIQNFIEHNRTLTQDEISNIIISLQNWILRREYTTCRESVNIGDIFYADLGLNYKPEFSYHHPVIIIEKIGNMVIVLPVSTSKNNINTAYHPVDNKNGSKYLRKVYGKDKGQLWDGFEKTGAVLLSDLKAISKGKLISKKGSLKDINNPNSLFKEIKTSTFKLTFPKEYIEKLKVDQQLKELQEKHDILENELKELQKKHDIL